MKNKRILIAMAAAAAIFTTGILLARTASQPVYVVDVFVGDVQVSINGGSWKNADVGMELSQADKIKTA